MLLTGSVVALALMAVGCVDKPHHPALDEVRLRIVPENSTVSSRGDVIFAMVEVAQPPSTSGDLTLRFHAENGTPLMLPGPAFCAVLADSGVAATDRPDGAAESADLTFPPATQRLNSARAVREVGLMIRVPAGDDDAILTASAYSAGSPFDCATPQGELKAFAFLRIIRTRPGAAPDASDTPPDASDVDGSPQDANSDGGHETPHADASGDASAN
jgi:hypothetical protein